MTKSPEYTRERKRLWYRKNAEALKEYARERYQQGKSTILGNARILVKTAKVRAKRRGMDFTITVEDVVAMAEATGGCCARTGIPFQLDRRLTDPFQMSLDRIESSKGYTPDNVQLVVLIYNLAKNTADDADLLRFAQELVKKSS